MGDHEGRAARSRREDVGGERVGSLGVEMLTRLVEHHDRKIGEQPPGERQALPLASRQTGAVCAHTGVQVLGEGLDPIEEAYPGKDAAYLVIFGVRAGEQEVFAQRGVEHVRPLLDQPDCPSDVLSDEV